MTQTVFVLLFAVTAFGSMAQAADPQPYRVEIASVGDGEMDATLKATSDLQSLRKTAPVSPFGLIARARSDVDRLKTALESFGYYESAVAIKINGMPVANPGLGDTLTALPNGTDAQVAIGFTLGPLYHLRSIDIDGDLPDAMSGTLGLSPGQPAVAAAVLAAGSRLLTALQERAYAFAKVDPPIAYQAADEPVLDLRFHVETGPKVNIGAIHIEGLKRVHESLMRARLRLRTGEPYSASAIEQARRDLLGTGRVQPSQPRGRYRSRRLRRRTCHLQGPRTSAPRDFRQRRVLERLGRQRRYHLDRPQCVRQCGAADPRRESHQSRRQRHDRHRVRHQRKTSHAGFRAPRSIAAIRAWAHSSSRSRPTIKRRGPPT